MPERAGPGRAGPERTGPEQTGPQRTGRRSRHTRETRIDCYLDLDGTGASDVSTGLPFFDHMLCQFPRHAPLDLSLNAEGDLAVDAHHTVEDTGIVLGQALAEALGTKAGIRRFSSIALPLDESLVEVALDLSGRAYLHYEVDLPPDARPLGEPGFDPQLAEEFWRAWVTAAAITLHLRLVRGRNTHHILEAGFKAVARALGDAARAGGSEVPSTKGQLG